ncbi:hypothetical protein IWQ57_001902 [Coemansia nantahalensis]|uniref:Uncharacterized protein n=1 Tax=Coemansia nantahalensis TaxID=2789366 RepID=A0ACC1K2A2_9FUNG|nr:hypothetical protein IWQ57_001902 [Coemansia nantahalensis]
MGYAGDCAALWERSADQRSKDTAGTVALLEAAAAGAAQGAPHAELVGSLAVAGSYAEPSFEWVGPAVQRSAEQWIAAIAAQLGMDGGCRPTLDATVFQELCAARVRPYFAPPQQEQRPQFVLAGESGRGRSLAPRRWREWPQSTAAFVWAFGRLADGEIKDAIPSILPVVLALVDDYDDRAKLRGLRLARALAERGDREFLRKSGVAGVVDSSVSRCLAYRADANELAAPLLEAAFQAALATGDVLYPSRGDPRYTEHWWRLADQLATNDVYIADNVAAATVLGAQVAPLADRLGPAIARHLRPLVGVVIHPLRSPASLAAPVCRLHAVMVRQMPALAAACPARVRAYVGDLVAALAVSWNSVAGKRAEPLCADAAVLRPLILDALRCLRALHPDAVRAAVDRLSAARPAVFAEWSAADAAAGQGDGTH